MCRTELEENELEENELEENELEENELVEPKDEWMINPSTKRRIKIGGKTWNYLKNSGVL